MPILEVKELCKSYQQASRKISVLDKLQLKAEKGETLSIIGQSGSGKSTLLSLIAGLDRPDTGSISLENKDIVNMPEEELALFRGKNIGIVFQHFHLIPQLNALENVSLPLEILKDQQAKKKAKEALSMVGLSDRAEHFPHQLSGGELQRVAIARAFVIEPAMIIADEPSGNLDGKTGDEVMQLLFSKVKEFNMTLVLVTHNTELAKQCEKRYELHSGQLH